jgi:uncharacterized surface protein with fasciclin (FAS1) repeats
MKKNFLHSFLASSAVRFSLILSLGVFVASCDKADYITPNPDADQSSKNIIETLSGFEQDAPANGTATESNAARGNNQSFSTLNVALARTGLAADVSRNRLTIFAPTDAAFAALGLYPNNIASVPNLREILLYHVVGAVVTSNQLSNGLVPTLNGAAVKVDLSAGVKINDANVVNADIMARNGVIHAIDMVLFPPDKNLVQLALSLNPEFSILVAAVQKANLVDVLAKGGPYTVFAPTNAAFEALLEELPFNSLDEIPVDVLTKVLLYHVVDGRVFSSDLTSGDVKTLNGTFNVNVNTLKITDFQKRESGLIPSLLDVQASNGVVHVIDRVLLPKLD